MKSTPRDIKELANALIAVAHEDDVVARVVDDVRLVQHVAQTERALFGQINETAIPLEERLRAFRNATQDAVHPAVINAICALVRRDLGVFLPAFADEVARMAQAIASHTEVRVTSVGPLTDDERTQVQELLKKKLNGTQRIVEHTDPNVLGGLVLEFEGRRYDASVRGNLERLKQSLYV